MSKTVAIGIQDFGDLVENDCFYVDKTKFIKEWWESRDAVTLITRPRRFGKTLTMSMVEYFFSNKYADKGNIFEKLDIWKYEEYRKFQGTYPVISLSFANVKEKTYEDTKACINQILTDLYSRNYYIMESDVLTKEDREYFKSVTMGMPEKVAIWAVHKMSDFLYRYYGKKVIILLDEYDTPMQEAYVNGYWDEMVSFTRSIFNSTFKTNPYSERAIMTGITRVSKESVFSDLNNLKVVTTTSEKYADVFGFTEEEVFNAMDEMGMSSEKKKEVKQWYDGFIFGKTANIYNPWSIINFLDEGKLKTYWANSSSNSLVGKLLRESNSDVKKKFEDLIMGMCVCSEIDEEIVYNQLGEDTNAIWSLLLSSGYLKAINIDDDIYELKLTNYEVRKMFKKLVKGWFGRVSSDYNDFIKALLLDDTDAMNEYMNRISYSVFSYFDVGRDASRAEPERFYHGFVLGLIVDLEGRYIIQSNRESGFGRYDVILEPLSREDNAFIIEFKAIQRRKENSLEETVEAALKQIEEKNYEQVLFDHGVTKERIRKYGFAFEGKNVLIGSSDMVY